MKIKPININGQLNLKNFTVHNNILICHENLDLPSQKSLPAIMKVNFDFSPWHCMKNGVCI